MGQNRVTKFERMLKYQANQVELLQQQISVQQALINALHQEQQQLGEQLADLQASPSNSANALAAMQQCELAMIEAQKKIKAKKIEISSADEKLDHLLHTYRDENRRLNAWEKLVDRERNKEQASVLSLHLRQADEIFLLSKLGRANR